jgi:hypothetical protein
MLKSEVIFDDFYVISCEDEELLKAPARNEVSYVHPVHPWHGRL